jgi:hypothetical protein
MDQARLKWIKTTALTVLGGGIAGMFSAAMDPTKYSLAHDFGSGKLWKYFAMGAGLTLGALLVKSPLGVSALSAYQQSQAQAKEDAALLDKVKKDITEAAKKEP